MYGLQHPAKKNSNNINWSKTTKLILLDSLLQEIGDACLPTPPCEVDQADTFR
jgi:hypothetical protein